MNTLQAVTPGEWVWIKSGLNSHKHSIQKHKIDFFYWSGSVRGETGGRVFVLIWLQIWLQIWPNLKILLFLHQCHWFPYTAIIGTQRHTHISIYGPYWHTHISICNLHISRPLGHTRISIYGPSSDTPTFNFLVTISQVHLLLFQKNSWPHPHSQRWTMIRMHTSVTKFCLYMSLYLTNSLKIKKNVS